jgi:transposase-like protein
MAQNESALLDLIFNDTKKENMALKPIRHTYDEAFKRKAVQMLVESGKSVIAAAESIGVERSILTRWKSKYSHEFIRKPSQSTGKPIGEDEFASLRSEVESIKTTVEDLRNIIKKSLTVRYLHE